MPEVNHKKRKHALLSASGANRWLNCAPSPVLEERYGKDTTSVYAAEGTLAHEFADTELSYFHNNITKAVYDKTLKKLRANKLYSSEMEGQVEKYTSYCIEQYNVAAKAGGVALTEQRVDFSHIVPEGFGTGDYSVIADAMLEVVDLKYGMTRVSAEDNPQLKLYALGLLNKFELSYSIDNVMLTIVQPRLNAVSNWVISVNDLYKWAEEVVKPTAAIAIKGEGEQVAGTWCKYCKVKPKCKALAKLANQAAKADFVEPMLLTEAEILKAFKTKKIVEDWLKSVEKYIKEEAIAGKTWEGFKLVAGTTKRKWADEDAVLKLLRANKFPLSKIQNKKLKGIGDISQLMSVDKFEKLLSEHIIKPEGAPTVVPKSDKRTAIGLASAIEDFS